MVILKKITFIALAIIFSLTYTVPNNNALAINNDNISTFDKTIIEQLENLVEITYSEVRNEWIEHTQYQISNDLEIKSTNLDYSKAKVYSHADNNYITVSIPVISPKHYGEVSNVTVHYSDSQIVESYSELLVKESDIGTFQIEFYLDGVEDYKSITDEKFYTFEEFKKGKINVITPLGLNFNGFIKCMGLPGIVGMELGTICAIACATLVLCVPCIAVSLGFSTGAIATCVYANWD